MTIDILARDPLTFDGDLLVIGCFHDEKQLRKTLEPLDAVLHGAVAHLVATRAFHGKAGQCLTFPTMGVLPVKEIVLLGLGEQKSMTSDQLRKMGGRACRYAYEHRASSVGIVLPSVDEKRCTPTRAAQACVEAFLLAAYRFHAFKGMQHKKDDLPPEPKALHLFVDTVKIVPALKHSIEKAEHIVRAVASARDLVNTPSSDMTPKELARHAQALATKGSCIRCKILDQKAMERLGMHAALAVARGSMHPPVGVHLTYTPPSFKKTVALVGKAVTFDSGGLSLKTADGMMTMKIDMAGAATVIGLFRALTALRPNVAVHGIFLAVENMPSGSAYRPGDIVKAMDGTTIEVLNTDAEGRLTLADALTYAIREANPDVLIDLATLTGACISALGEEVAGLFANDEKLAASLLSAARTADEALWRLPLQESYTQYIRSKIADIKNVGGGGGGGAITAALFLKTFVKSIPWAHIDIAGPSYTERENRPDQPYGASGYGVRLLVEFLEEIGP